MRPRLGANANACLGLPLTRDALRLRSLLSAPIVKFCLVNGCDFALAVCLTMPSTADLAKVTIGAPLLALASTTAFHEVSQLFTIESDGREIKWNFVAYWSERFNRLDMPAILMTIGALVSALYLDRDVAQTLEQPSQTTRNLRAFAALLLWLRMVRVLLIFPWSGPYVLMIFTMLQDVFKFVGVLFAFVLAFAAAFFALYEPAPQDRVLHWKVVREDVRPDGDDTCTDHLYSYLSAVLFLLETSVTGGEFFECMRNSSEYVSGWVLALLFYAIGSLLLLNMLIAMSARTPCDRLKVHARQPPPPPRLGTSGQVVRQRV